MKKYKSIYKESSNLINSFKSYYLNKEEFGNRMINEVKKMISKGDFIKNSEVKYISGGKKADCEVNSYNYAKKNNMQVVQGYTHNADEDDFWWFAHSWVYDPINKKHIEVTPYIENSIGRVGRIVKKELLKKKLGLWGNLKNGDYEEI